MKEKTELKKTLCETDHVPLSSPGTTGGWQSWQPSVKGQSGANSWTANLREHRTEVRTLTQFSYSRLHLTFLHFTLPLAANVKVNLYSSEWHIQFWEKKTELCLVALNVFNCKRRVPPLAPFINLALNSHPKTYVNMALSTTPGLGGISEGLYRKSPDPRSCLPPSTPQSGLRAQELAAQSKAGFQWTILNIYLERERAGSTH